MVSRDASAVARVLLYVLYEYMEGPGGEGDVHVLCGGWWYGIKVFWGGR